MDSKPKIPCSVAILTLNCREDLKRCLDTLKDFEEIIILDGNSTDGTPELAREYGAKVYPQVETEEKNVRIKNFTAMRIKAIEMTTKDWVFEMDADEYIPQELTDEIREFIEKNGSDSAPLISRLAVIDGKIIKYSPTYPQFFVRIAHKRSGIAYKTDRLVHEKWDVPDNIRLQKLKNATFAPWPSYDDCIKKDNFYLSLASKGYAGGLKNFKTKSEMLKKTLRKSFINIFKAVKIFLKSLRIYLRHGYGDSLPIKYVWRFVRYHLILSYKVLRVSVDEVFKNYK